MSTTAAEEEAEVKLLNEDNLVENENEENLLDENDEAEVDEQEQAEPKPFSYIEMLDKAQRRRQLDLDPIDLTMKDLKQIAEELGLIKLCWPEIREPNFEGRTNFPQSYLTNSNKEKLLLLYAENFRRQFSFKYPDRKPLILACDNECGLQKMVCTTIRPTTLPYSQIHNWEECAQFVADHIKYEIFEEPKLIPKHLYSPHSTILHQTGHCFELATVLCSLLIGAGLEAYVISGYAIMDITQRILLRVQCPLKRFQESMKEIDDENGLMGEENSNQKKYKVGESRNLQSKFLAMMRQRELDKIEEEEEKLRQEERERILKEEQRPEDPLEGQRIHGWVYVAADPNRNIPEGFFLEPSTGMSHKLTTDVYIGIESLWNHENYWINLQNCAQGLGELNYDLTNCENWEHLLIGEPLKWRKEKVAEIGEDEENEDFWDEKHLDMPQSWSMKIDIPHDVLKRRFPGGFKVTQFKRTLVEEFAEYACDDGLVKKITHYFDFNLTEIEDIEEEFVNRHDKLIRDIWNGKTNLETEYFATGREDSVTKHVFYKNQDYAEAERTIFFNSKARFDGLEKIEISGGICTTHYSDRDDKLYYRQVVYDPTPSSSEETHSTNRRAILKIIQKFLRNEEKSAYDDISLREFNIRSREIKIKYHYGTDKVTASTRTFIKPPLSEMGEGMVFHPELTFGYQAEIGGKPPRQLQLFQLLQQQLEDEKELIESIRDFEILISDFLLLRAHEMAFSKLDVSVYNREQNQEYRQGMLEQEEKQRVYKEKEIEEEIDYLSPYLARLGNPNYLTYNQALEVKYACLKEFKELLVNRANDIQRQFEKTSNKIEEMQTWYTQNHENLTPEQEAKYFQEVNDLLFYLRSLEIRLNRHKELSYARYELIVQYVNNHPLLEVLQN